MTVTAHDDALTAELRRLADYLAKCDHGVNQGKPGVCPEDRPDATGQQPVAPQPDAAASFDAIQTKADSHAASLVRLASSIPAKVYESAKAKVGSAYEKLAGRYGKKLAVVIVGAGLIGTATPVPGGGIVAAAPLIGAAELYLKLRSVTATGKDFTDLLARTANSTGASSARIYLATPDSIASFARKSLRKIYVVDDPGTVRQAKALASSQGIEVVPTAALRPRSAADEDFAERSKSFLAAVEEEAESETADNDARATLLIGHADHFGQKAARPGAYLRLDGRGGQWQTKVCKCMEGTNAHKPGPCPQGGGDNPTSPERTRPEPSPTSPDSPTRQTSGDTAVAERREAASKTPVTAADKSSVHKTLEQTPVKRSSKLKKSTNETHLLTLEDGTQAVFKPAKGESKDPRAGRFGVPQGTQYKREIAAGRVAEVLGFNDLVPTTTVRNQGGDIGSAQAYVANAPEAADTPEPYDGPVDAARAAAFDYLIGHLDRHSYNWLVQGDKLALIDNGLSFPTHYDKRDFFNMRFWDYASKNELPLPDMRDLADKWPMVESELHAAGLEPEAIELTGKRFAALTSGNRATIGELPSLLPGSVHLDVMAEQDRQARREAAAAATTNQESPHAS